MNLLDAARFFVCAGGKPGVCAGIADGGDVNAETLAINVTMLFKRFIRGSRNREQTRIFRFAAKISAHKIF